MPLKIADLKLAFSLFVISFFRLLSSAGRRPVLFFIKNLQ
ncbi:hypothetical protein CHCC14821_4050 [Bacillus paralicheniformis]|nr:hypothetical protein CHCC14821_4050 [Bacillus paralicheniformis]TWM58107.1 hypothetical protein CHCC14814_3179 [Bacillus paralicheniformis]